MLHVDVSEQRLWLKCQLVFYSESLNTVYHNEALRGCQWRYSCRNAAVGVLKSPLKKMDMQIFWRGGGVDAFLLDTATKWAWVSFPQLDKNSSMTDDSVPTCMSPT